MSAEPVEFGFVAALEREVRGLVRGWRAVEIELAGEPARIYLDRQAALICAGTGVERAYAAANALLERYSPRVMISIGFAGSCVRRLQPGSIVVPGSLLEAATGETFTCAFGCGQLVTLDRVAGKSLKEDARMRFGALAVDMEAAGVARAAAGHNREFAAIKAISDGAAEDLGFLADFVKPEGFETSRFVAHIGVRPGLWPRVATLNRNSKLAATALAGAVGECMSDWRKFSHPADGHRTSSMKESG